MKSIEKSIAESLDCERTSILPFLPYILQDFWEIGSSADSILSIVKENTKKHYDLKVLDLGCGKGAVSIKLSTELNCTCFGIDAIEAFIDIAVEKAEVKAEAKEIGDRCKFTAGDARELIKKLGMYDVIVLGSIGPVFGTYFETMMNLKNHLRTNGIIILDDGYIEDSSTFEHNLIAKKSTLLEQLDNASMKLVREYVGTKVDKSDKYESEYMNIIKRCEELGKKYPDKKKLFEDYIIKQRNEYDILEEEVTCSTMVICKNE